MDAGDPCGICLLLSKIRLDVVRDFLRYFV
ncbi:Uncharacterised protein [Mycobacteroides abscessus subsp. abscessus]|nr:Uncharacterised protein [Mycobacteroides abscessus subsp. abscessus]